MEDVFAEVKEINNEISILEAKRDALIVTTCQKNNIDYPEFNHRYMEHFQEGLSACREDG